MKAYKVLSICLILFLTSATYAQDKKLRIGIFHGIDFLTSGRRPIVTPPDIFLDLEYLLNRKMGIGIEAGWVQFDRLIQTSNPPIKDRTDRFMFFLKYRYYLNVERKVNPYISLGVGSGYYNGKDGEFVGANLVYTTYQQFRFAVNPELGIKISWFNLGIGFNYINKFDLPNTANFNSIEINVGGSFYLVKKNNSEQK